MSLVFILFELLHDTCSELFTSNNRDFNRVGFDAICDQLVLDVLRGKTAAKLILLSISEKTSKRRFKSVAWNYISSQTTILTHHFCSIHFHQRFNTIVPLTKLFFKMVCDLVAIRLSGSNSTASPIKIGFINMFCLLIILYAFCQVFQTFFILFQSLGHLLRDIVSLACYFHYNHQNHFNHCFKFTFTMISDYKFLEFKPTKTVLSADIIMHPHRWVQVSPKQSTS